MEMGKWAELSVKEAKDQDEEGIDEEITEKANKRETEEIDGPDERDMLMGNTKEKEDMKKKLSIIFLGISYVNNIVRKWNRKHFCVFIAVVVLTAVIIRHYSSDFFLDPSVIYGPNEKLTIRVNTFRRLDLLEIFLDQHAYCDAIEEIQVVWSDLENKAPLDWEAKYPKGIVKFEIHSKNSLNNRFLPLSEIRTNAVLSIDDDLAVGCEDIKFAIRVWQANSDTMVGFSPRLTTRDIKSGMAKYLRWQHTWWNGKYTLMLTKIAIIHKKFLTLFKDTVPENVLNYIDRHRNCEDIAMSHIIAEYHRGYVPPVWVEGIVYDTGLATAGGISSGGSHFLERGKCIDIMSNMTRSWPWVVGYQKAIPIGVGRGDYFGFTDFFRLR